MILENNYQLLIGSEELLPAAEKFNQIFREINAPATGRFPGLLVWMRTHPEFEPWGILVELDGNLVAAAILTRRYSLGIWRIGKPGGNFDPVHFAALNDAAALKLAQAIYSAAESFGGHWVLEISDLPCPDTVVNYMQTTWKCCKSKQNRPIPFLLFKPDTPLNSYLSSNTRSAVAKAVNRIKRNNFEMIKKWTRDKSEIQKVLPEVLAVYSSRDHQKYGNCLIDEPMSERFFIEFITEHADQDLIDLLTIRINSELAAFALCLFDNGFHWVLVNRASPKWLNFSPGTIANAEVVIHAFEDTDSKGVNWDGPLTRYKLSGEVMLIPRQTLYAWSSGTVRWLQKIKQYLSKSKDLTFSFRKIFN